MPTTPEEREELRRWYAADSSFSRLCGLGLSLLAERDALAEARPCVEVCRAEREAGNGGCSACALCCKEQRERAEAAEAEVARLTQDRDALAASNWAALARVANVEQALGILRGTTDDECADLTARVEQAERDRDRERAAVDRLDAAHIDGNLDMQAIARERDALAEALRAMLICHADRQYASCVGCPWQAWHAAQPVRISTDTCRARARALVEEK